MAVRRLGFYARCGAKDTGWTEHLFDAWFRVLVLPCCGGKVRSPEEAVRQLARLLPPHHGRAPVAQERHLLPPRWRGGAVLRG